MVKFTTDAVTIEVGVGIVKDTGRVLSPTKVELLAIRIAHRCLLLALGTKVAVSFSLVGEEAGMT